MKAELTDWQIKKFECLFDLFDNDGDKVVDESELEGTMERLQVDTGWPENSRVLSHVSARWKVLLRNLFVDSPHLTSQKWLEFLARFLAKDREQRSADASHRGNLEEFAQLLFLLLDRDRDSKIDYQEFLIYFYALGLKDGDAEDSFDKFDTNSDGFISKGEMEDMILEFFHSSEPGSHGDWLFGKPPSDA